ncbi:VanW family protein [Clostridium sp. 'deep sea']|uniref:VanW family protein n=1 Tax=Clostridium sp. 'deep sea' TaxID=2779445 RepID=UPI00189679BB|nr:VanW family protein [Clostridium sp. 'deep sea']QOR34774.1 VanW family protein [Clostridium sp. 'deep sea']
MKKKLFCELHPITYNISVFKGVLVRRIKWVFSCRKYSHIYLKEHLPTVVYQHKSLIRRQLGDVDMQLQENKAHNLAISTPKVNGILIKPKEVFSFWRLVGKCSKSKGYKEGLFIKFNKITKGTGGGICQFSNLIHWLVLHSPLQIVEKHRHFHADIFPDSGRKVPFGTGTSIMYNYLDYQFVNNTSQTFQLVTYINNGYLVGELRSESAIVYNYEVVEEEHYFEKLGNDYYRHNKVYKITKDSHNNIISRELIVENYAKVLYDHKFIPREKILN